MQRMGLLSQRGQPQLGSLFAQLLASAPSLSRKTLLVALPKLVVVHLTVHLPPPANVELLALLLHEVCSGSLSLGWQAFLMDRILEFTNPSHLLSLQWPSQVFPVGHLAPGSQYQLAAGPSVEMQSMQRLFH